jgi:hypothetical protein
MIQVDENDRQNVGVDVNDRQDVEKEEDDVVAELGNVEGHAIYRRLSGGPKRAPPLGMLHKQVHK